MQKLVVELAEILRTEFVEPISDKAIDSLLSPLSSANGTQELRLAIDKALKSLDPYAAYLNTAVLYHEIQQSKCASGIVGIYLGSEQDPREITDVAGKMPAIRSGIRAGDIITHIDDKCTNGLSSTEIKALLGGKRGTACSLILRRGKKVFQAKLDREIPVSQRVEWEQKGALVYLRIPEFNFLTGYGLDLALINARATVKEGVEGYVVDFRNNPGGCVEGALTVAGKFLNSGLEILSTESRPPKVTERYVSADIDSLNNAPLAVLINNKTASSSEIVAGAWQLHNRAVLVGAQSAGKGVSQKTILLKNWDGAVRLTAARNLLPDGSSIHGTGLIPDIAADDKAADNPEFMTQILRERKAAQQSRGIRPANVSETSASPPFPVPACR